MLAAVLLIALAARLGYGWLRPYRDGKPLPDVDNFTVLACSFADSASLAIDGRPTAAREPFYPILLGSAFAVFGKSPNTIFILNCVLGTLAVWGVYLVGTGLFGSGVALAAAAIAALYPPFIFYAAMPVRETTMVCLSLASLGFLLHAIRTGRARLFAAAGAAGALAALTNTTFLPFGLAVAPAILAWISRKNPKNVFVYAVVFFLLWGAWPLRNGLVFHRFIPGSTSAAGRLFYFYQVIPQEVGGTEEEALIMRTEPVERGSLAISDLAGRDAYFWNAGWAKVRENPLRWARLVAWRFFIDQWRLVPRKRPYAQGYAAVKWASLLSDGWIIPAGLAGLALALRSLPLEAGLVLLFIGCFHFAYALILTIIRYRLPVMPWVILFAVYALTEAAGRLRKKIWPILKLAIIKTERQ